MYQDKESKLKALNLAIDRIDKTFGKGTIMRLGDKQALDVEAISSGSLGLDIALGVNGFPKGRIVEIYGPESSGKTTLAIHAIAECQKSGGIAAFIDAEHAFDRSYAEALGVAIGMPAITCARISGVSFPAVMSVAMKPGQSALTRTPSGASSRAIALVRPSTPALAAE